VAASADYDAPSRKQAADDDEDSGQILAALGLRTRSRGSGPDESGADGVDEALGLLVADLSNWLSDEPTAQVVPQQPDEFTCSRCFLIHPRSRLVRSRRGRLVCRDCA
jgi:hypothetical protein